VRGPIGSGLRHDALLSSFPLTNGGCGCSGLFIWSRQYTPEVVSASDAEGLAAMRKDVGELGLLLLCGDFARVIQVT
jgi:hypothetical protein